MEVCSAGTGMCGEGSGDVGKREGNMRCVFNVGGGERCFKSVEG